MLKSIKMQCNAMQYNVKMHPEMSMQCKRKYFMWIQFILHKQKKKYCIVISFLSLMQWCCAGILMSCCQHCELGREEKKQTWAEKKL